MVSNALPPLLYARRAFLICTMITLWMMVQVAGGKQFAKRATMYDAMFMGVGSLTSRRDEGLLALVVKMVFRVLVNLTVGLFMAVLEFVFSVWRVSVSGI